MVPNRLTVAVVGILSCNAIFAAPDPPAPVPPPPPGLPIDGAIWLVMTVVLLYAFIKIKNTKKASN